MKKLQLLNLGTFWDINRNNSEIHEYKKMDDVSNTSITELVIYDNFSLLLNFLPSLKSLQKIQVFEILTTAQLKFIGKYNLNLL